MTLYHYTNINALLGIIDNTGLCFHATFFKKFKGTDYDIIQPVGYKVIEEICKEENEGFSIENNEYQPCIISFCKNGDSDYMWKEYADVFCGGMLILDAEVLRKYSQDNWPNPGDCFKECKYIDNRNIKTEIIQYLDENIESIPDTRDRQNDLITMLGFLKVQSFKQEEEYRYVRPYPILAKSHNDPNSVDNCSIDDNPEPDKNKYYEEVLFPKEALIGIKFGLNARWRDIAKVKKHLENCAYKIDQKSESEIFIAKDKNKHSIRVSITIEIDKYQKVTSVIYS